LFFCGFAFTGFSFLSLAEKEPREKKQEKRNKRKETREKKQEKRNKKIEQRQ